MSLFALSPNEFKLFLLIFIRVSVVLFLFPIFGARMFPSLVKVGLALVISMALYPVIRLDIGLFPGHAPGFVIFIVAEFIVGMLLGLTVRIFLAAVELAGQLIGFQMGFAIMNVIDPQSGTQVSIMGQIGNLTALLIFLAIDGHHALIGALIESFQLVNVGQVTIQKGLFVNFISMSGSLFALAIKIGAPAITALLFTSAAFGLTAKFAPQMNILIAAFPVKIAVGLAFFGFSLQIISILCRNFVSRFPALANGILTSLGGG